MRERTMRDGDETQIAFPGAVFCDGGFPAPRLSACR